MRIHTGEKNYVCPENGCGARFSRQDNCMQHYRTHQVHGSKRRTGSSSSTPGISSSKGTTNNNIGSNNNDDYEDTSNSSKSRNKINNETGIRPGTPTDNNIKNNDKSNIAGGSAVSRSHRSSSSSSQPGLASSTPSPAQSLVSPQMATTGLASNMPCLPHVTSLLPTAGDSTNTVAGSSAGGYSLPPLAATPTGMGNFTNITSGGGGYRPLSYVLPPISSLSLPFRGSDNYQHQHQALPLPPPPPPPPPLPVGVGAAPASAHPVAGPTEQVSPRDRASGSNNRPDASSASSANASRLDELASVATSVVV
ncbi:uncharacterized protein V1516DRAFT_676407 [Lipomyces oligophaga]|uniref:uncharacterized protein n=1 Tax=Lipomyces oligophaga TaxID=45792 RepID=UPI0034CFDD3A